MAGGRSKTQTCRMPKLMPALLGAARFGLDTRCLLRAARRSARDNCVEPAAATATAIEGQWCTAAMANPSGRVQLRRPSATRPLEFSVPYPTVRDYARRAQVTTARRTP